MALARTHAIALVGVQGHVVEIEADIENGLVALLLVGLPDTALREARDRIRSAISQQPAVLAAAPHHRRPVAGQPAQAGQRLRPGHRRRPSWRPAASVPGGRLAGTVFLGELGLDGGLRPVPGVLPAVAAAAAAGFSRVVVPPENLPEAALVPACRSCSAPALGCADGLAARPQAGQAAAPPGAGRGIRRGARLCWATGRGVPDGGGPAWRCASTALRRRAAARPGGRRRPAGSAAGGGDLRRGRPSPDAARAARASARRCWPSGCRRSCRRCEPAEALEVSAIHSVAGTLTAGQPAGDRAAVLRAASHRHQGRHRRRRKRHHQAGRGVAGAPRLPVPGRGAGVRPRRAGRAAPAARVRRGRDRPVRA